MPLYRVAQRAMSQYTLRCDDTAARAVEGLAVRYGMTEEQVLEQLVDIGLQEVD